MATDVYRQLQQQLDTYSLGFPPTESGVEIRILKALFSEEDAAMFLALTPRLESPEEVAGRLNKPADQVAAHLSDMAGRGLLFSLRKGAGVKYGAIPFVHGLFEFQVQRLGRDLAELVEEYWRDGFDRAMLTSADHFLRTVPVNRAVEVTQQVAAYEDASEILKGKKDIVVAPCICRKQKEAIGQGCGKPLEVCFMFGSMGQYYLDHNLGRRVDTEEALAILQRAQEAGLVTQPATTTNPAGMCNCCGDCCGVLATLNRQPKPAELVFSNHYAVLDRDECVGCEACLERCQMGALTMDDQGLAVLNGDRCIGCGLCVTTCPSGALTLAAKAPDLQRVPPASAAEQMMLMAQKRGLL
jgi:ferredoxin